MVDINTEEFESYLNLLTSCMKQLPMEKTVKKPVKKLETEESKNKIYL